MRERIQVPKSRITDEKNIHSLIFKERPDVILSIEEKVRRDGEKKARRREARLRARQTGDSQDAIPS